MNISVQREQMGVVITGHVDHGKSTLIGRLLADTGTIPDGKLESVRRMCEHNAKPFEYAFLLDALKEEQAQGVTVDSARVFFKTEARDYLLIDAPGHVEFLKNMVSGASRAQAALLVVDAMEGVRENTRRHGYLLSMLGLRQVMVVINKMDLVGYAEDRFRGLENDCRVFLKEVGISSVSAIPVSAFLGDNILSLSGRMPWYTGPTLLEGLDAFVAEQPPLELPFRMPVQGVYKFTRDKDDRRIIAGTPYAGRLKAGDDVVFYPSGKKAQVKTIASDTAIEAGLASGFTLSEQVYVTRGEVAVRADEPPPSVSSVFRARLFWMGHTPLVEQRMYILKTGTARVTAFVEKIEQVMDAVTFGVVAPKGRVDRHEAAVCVIRAHKPLAVDTGDGPGARFVLVDGYDIAGGGMLMDGSPQGVSGPCRPVKTAVTVPEQKGTGFVVWMTGLSGSGKSTLAEKLCSFYQAQGLRVEHLDGDAVRAVFPQTGFSKKDRDAHIQRIGFIASLLERHGVIVVASFISPYRDARVSVRRMCGHFIEVYIEASLKECERRDPKGLYKKARAGRISRFTGIDAPYEMPESAQITISTEGQSVEESFDQLIHKLEILSLKHPYGH